MNYVYKIIRHCYGGTQVELEDITKWDRELYFTTLNSGQYSVLAIPADAFFSGQEDNYHPMIVATFEVRNTPGLFQHIGITARLY